MSGFELSSDSTSHRNSASSPHSRVMSSILSLPDSSAAAWKISWILFHRSALLFSIFKTPVLS
ncbi:MAG: hypothetical protein ACK5RS_03055, partial [Acidobacteriota bacterium]